MWLNIGLTTIEYKLTTINFLNLRINSHVLMQNIKTHIHDPHTHLNNLKSLRIREIQVSTNNHQHNNLHFMQNQITKNYYLLARNQQLHLDIVMGQRLNTWIWCCCFIFQWLPLMFSRQSSIRSSKATRKTLSNFFC